MHVTTESLAHCSAEPIATPELVQAFGAMVVLSPADARVVRYSPGALFWLGASQLEEVDIRELLTLDGCTWERCLLEATARPSTYKATTAHSVKVDLLVHMEPVGGRIILEIVPAVEESNAAQEESHLYANLSRAIHGLSQSVNLKQFWVTSSELLRDVLKYERVMVYRFESDHSGVVVAEATAVGVPQRFLNLRFPEGDIPAQARALYERNPIRVIADVEAAPEPLLGGLTPVDQSHCLLRQPSEMHLQYLRNMGVRATLTVSLMRDGKLWGMLACHHSTPKVPPYHLHRSLLTVCELLATAFNSRLDIILKLEQAEAESVLQTEIVQVGHLFQEEKSEEACLSAAERLIKGNLPVSTVSITAPCESQCGREHCEPCINANSASVCIRLEQSKSPVCLSWSRASEDEEWVWGGNPADHEPVHLADGRVLLGPRRSFEMWKEKKGSANQVWTEVEKARVQKICNALGRASLTRLANQQATQLHLLGAALDQSKDMVIVTNAQPSEADGSRAIIYVNRSLLTHSGYAREDLIGRSPSIFQGPLTETEVVQRIAIALANKRPVSEVLTNYRKDGTTFTNDLHITPVSNDSGHVQYFLSVQRDVTAQRALVESINEKSRFLEELTENLPAAIFIFRRAIDGSYHIDFGTSQFYSLIGLNAEQCHSAAVFGAILPADLQGVIDSIERVTKTRGHWRHRFRVNPQDDKSPRTLEGRSAPVASEDGESRWFGLLLDVTDQVEMESALNEAMREQSATLAAIPEKLIELDENGTLLKAHIRGNTLLGIDVDLVLNRRASEVFSSAVHSQLTEAIREAASFGISSRREVTFQSRGSTQHRGIIVARKDRSNNSHTYICSVSDITSAKQSEARIRFLVNHDELTHLLNRRGFQEQLNRVHVISRDEGSTYGLIFVDLDHFKHLNDAHGHRAGDQALKLVAARVKAVASSSDIVARLGGDEFVVLVRGENAQVARQYATGLAQKIHQEISQPLNLEGLLFLLTCSIGVSIAEDLSDDSDDIMRWADLAMYSVKQDGRNGVCFFSEEVHQKIISNIQLGQALRHALERDEFQVHGQPIVDASSRTLGFECLLRWHMDHRLWIAPSEFIPLAEQTGQIIPIGYWVLEQACRTLRDWQNDSSLQQFYLAVNISYVQIKQQDFIDRLADLLKKYAIRPDRLKLEMTESLLLDDAEGGIRKLDSLRAMGVTVSLDDFGTGYSSLAYLLKLPIDELKMDRSFLLNALDEPRSATLARMIFQMASSLNLEVIAEGVETDQQFQFLLGLGCKKFQGYKFGRPSLLANCITGE